MSKRLLLTAPNINGSGDYQYRIISLQEAIDWLRNGRFTCDIRLTKLTMALHTLTGLSIYPNMVGGPPMKVEVGDEALIFEVERNEHNRSLFHMETEYILTHYTFGVFRKYDLPADVSLAAPALLAIPSAPEIQEMDDGDWSHEDDTGGYVPQRRGRRQNKKWSTL